MIFEQLPAEIKSFYQGKNIKIRNVKFAVSHISGDEAYVVESHNSDGLRWEFVDGIWKNKVIPSKSPQVYRK
jgi:hypothetical protein